MIKLFKEFYLFSVFRRPPRSRIYARFFGLKISHKILLGPYDQGHQRTFAPNGPDRPNQPEYRAIRGKKASNTKMLAIWPIRTAFKECGLNDTVINRKMIASFHTLRYTYTSRLVQRGIDLLRVARLMGHSDIKMTTRYAKLNDNDLHEAVKVLEQRNGTEPQSTSPTQVFKRSDDGKVIPFRKRA